MRQLKSGDKIIFITFVSIILSSCQNDDKLSDIQKVANEYLKDCIINFQDKEIPNYLFSNEVEIVKQHISQCRDYSTLNSDIKKVMYRKSGKYEIKIKDIIYEAINIHVSVELNNSPSYTKYIFTLLKIDKHWKVYALGFDTSGV